MTLSSNSFQSLGNQEVIRLQRKINRKQRQRNRSQYSGRISDYDADRGEALISVPQGGIIYAESITTSSNLNVGVSVPQLDTRGKADAKPAA